MAEALNSTHHFDDVGVLTSNVDGNLTREYHGLSRRPCVCLHVRRPGLSSQSPLEHRGVNGVRVFSTRTFFKISTFLPLS